MHQFNQTMNYLETVLDSEIDSKKVQQLSGYSYAMISRLFSILADMTLDQYLRNRRLTLAVNDLKESSDKIIDIAIKYGYDSAQPLRNFMVPLRRKFALEVPIRSSQPSNYH